MPFERPAMTEALQAIALEAFAPLSHDPRSVEIVLTRQSAPVGTAAAEGHPGAAEPTIPLKI